MKKLYITLIIMIVIFSFACRTSSLNQTARIIDQNSSEISGTYGFYNGLVYGNMPMFGTSGGFLLRYGATDLFEYQFYTELQCLFTPYGIVNSNPYTSFSSTFYADNQFKINLYKSDKVFLSLLPTLGFQLNYRPHTLLGVGYTLGLKLIGDYSLNQSVVFYYGPNLSIIGNGYAFRNNYGHEYIPEINVGFAWGWEIPKPSFMVLRHEFGISTTFTPGPYCVPTVNMTYSATIGKTYESIK